MIYAKDELPQAARVRSWPVRPADAVRLSQTKTPPSRERPAQAPQITDQRGLDPALQRLLDETDERQHDYLRCAQCATVICRLHNAIEVHGSHQHHCTNPHGYQFEVGCYNEALGCDIGGDRQRADSWFAGYEWRYASCSDCQQHLGWYFDRAEHYFYGLIIDRIAR